MSLNGREIAAFCATLAVLLIGFLSESLLGGKVLSPADVLYATPAFARSDGGDYEPANRLLMDPVLQFQPWLQWNRDLLRQGRLPLWNSLAGGGAPHLANGQSAVFDPFHLIAYLGRLPEAHAWMALARLFVAGLGMYLLAAHWGLGPWGRWFAGLCFPFSGFLILWLLYPVASSALWFPWIFLTTDRLLDRPGPGRVAALAACLAASLLAGQVQMTAHMMMATGLYTAWRLALTIRARRLEQAPTELALRFPARSLAAWAAGLALGVGLAAIEIMPLADYLSRSPVWADRQAEHPGPLALPAPRLLEAACTALPYAYGSQRRGHPNLARPLGVQNLNEAAGGFAGLATLLWLAPSAWRVRRARPRATFLAFLVILGAAGAFRIPPIANLLRGIPILDVIDHRRMTIYVAFGLVLLGGMALDHLRPVPLWWRRSWVAGAVALLALIVAARVLAPRLENHARRHYQAMAQATPGADAEIYQARASRQAANLQAFVPRYYGWAAAQLAGLALVASLFQRGRLTARTARTALMCLVLADLLGFGFGLNPAISRADDQPTSPLLSYLTREASPPARILALGDVIPPNALMRYGLADIRNYDSIELATNLDRFENLYEPGASRTSRRTVDWTGVTRARSNLRESGVAAVVGQTPPPEGLFPRVDRVGGLWVGRWPLVAPAGLSVSRDGRFEAVISNTNQSHVIVNESYDPGWRLLRNGQTTVPLNIAGRVGVPLLAGRNQISLWYEPAAVRMAVAVSLVAVGGLILLTLIAVLPPHSAGKTLDGSWKGPFHRVTIVPVTSSGLRNRVPMRG